MAVISWWCRAVGMLVVMVTTVLGNLAVLCALRRLKRTPAHYPLASLATADLLLGVLLPLTIMRHIHWHWSTCVLTTFFGDLCTTASILSICLICWEKWRGITAPFGRACRAKRVRQYATLLWVLATVLAVPSAFLSYNEHQLMGETLQTCSINTNILHVAVSSVISFFLPAIVMVAMYVRIVQALAVPQEMPMRMHRGQSPNPQVQETEINIEEARSPLRDFIQNLPIFPSPSASFLALPATGAALNIMKITSEEQINRDRFQFRQERARRRIVLIMSLFLLCWTPFFIMLITDSIYKCVPEVVRELLTWLSFMNSAINPFIYAGGSPSMKRALRDIFTTTSRSTDIAMTPLSRSGGRRLT